MGMVIRTNTMAVNAHRVLGVNQGMIGKSIEKLASGFRINRAGDDAAGLAISEKMKAQITGLEVAARNAQDGISFVQTSEGALTEVHDMLNRLVELGSMSANGIYTTNERQKLQDEVEEILDEIDRVSQATNFNGIRMLDGSMEVKQNNLLQDADAKLAVIKNGQSGSPAQAGIFSFSLKDLVIASDGKNDGKLTFSIGGQTVKVAGTTTAITLPPLKKGGQMTGSDIGIAINNGEVTLDGAVYSVKFDSATGNVNLTGKTPPTQALAATYTVTLSATNAQGTAGNQGYQFGMTVNQSPVPNLQAKAYAQSELDMTGLVKDGGLVKIGDTTYVFAVGKDSQFKGRNNAVDLTMYEATNADLTMYGANALTKAAATNSMFDVGTDLKGTTFKLQLTEKAGANIDYDKYKLGGADNKIGGAAATAKDWGDLIQYGQASLSGDPLQLQIGDSGDTWNQLKISVADMSTKGLGITGLNIMSNAKANEAVNIAKQAIDLVSRNRGKLGATQNRLEHTINSLNITNENITASNSRIRDTDMAKEMMNYTKMNVLTQAAQAMLAQANQQPQAVLQLLQ